MFTVKMHITEDKNILNVTEMIQFLSLNGNNNDCFYTCGKFVPLLPKIIYLQHIFKWS